MLKPAKNPIQQTAILCLVTLFLTYPKHGGFMLGFVVVILFPSLLKSLYYIFIKNKDRKQRIVQTTLWAITCSITIIHHIYLYKTTQTYAEEVSNSIVMYYQKNGDYPTSYDVIGLDKAAMREYGLYYSYKDKVPFLIYRATWIVFDTYAFNFNTKKWGYKPS